MCDVAEMRAVLFVSCLLLLGSIVSPSGPQYHFGVDEKMTATSLVMAVVLSWSEVVGGCCFGAVLQSLRALKEQSLF